jgi:hypothetical protein
VTSVIFNNWVLNYHGYIFINHGFYLGSFNTIAAIKVGVYLSMYTYTIAVKNNWYRQFNTLYQLFLTAIVCTLLISLPALVKN